jgi:hypothetical protein
MRSVSAPPLAPARTTAAYDSYATIEHIGASGALQAMEYVWPKAEPVPLVELPTAELPTPELPTAELPTAELPTAELPREIPTEPPKLAAELQAIAAQADRFSRRVSHTVPPRPPRPPPPARPMHAPRSTSVAMLGRHHIAAGPFTPYVTAG